ncbi:hypothetical protein FACS1894111_05950 [Clostridia bacterium]|nr:hypothetical protein FACS1894111_05950 [Clostridia bacterium]
MENNQLSLFGKTYPEHSAVTKEMIFGQSLKKSQRPVFQCLKVEDGQLPEWLEVGKGEQVSHGGNLIRSIGEFPNVENESSLWEILEPKAHHKYSLSAKACLGMLKRAEKRGKKLPELLSAVLKIQAGKIKGKVLLILEDKEQE